MKFAAVSSVSQHFPRFVLSLFIPKQSQEVELPGQGWPDIPGLSWELGDGAELTQLEENEPKEAFL